MYKTQKDTTVLHNCAVKAQVICATHSTPYEQQTDLIKEAIASLLVTVAIVATCMVS